jgi:hypothetical protein
MGGSCGWVISIAGKGCDREGDMWSAMAVLTERLKHEGHEGCTKSTKKLVIVGRQQLQYHTIN